MYSKNAMQVHYDINKKVPLTREHFEAWLRIFNDTLDEAHEGRVTGLAKKRARSIAGLMLLKMTGNGNLS